MKLGLQVCCLLAIPLISQLVFTTTFVDGLRSLDKAVERESTAKKILALCLDNRRSAFNYNVALLGNQLANSPASIERRKQIVQKVARDFNELKQLVGNDRDALILLEQFAAELHHADELVGTIHVERLPFNRPDVFSHRFINMPELQQELSHSLKRALEKEQLLRDRYTPIVEQFRPQALRHREFLTTITAIFGFLNIGFAVGFAATFGQYTLARLAVLMKNVDEFAERRVALTPITGDDEIAELDKKFRVIAVARHDAEEVRKSIYTMVSHELRNPLTAVRESLSLIDTSHLDVRGEQLLAKIDCETNRVLRIATTFLDLQKIESGTIQIESSVASISKLFEQAREATYSLCSARNITVHSEVTGPQDCSCDADRVVQVIVNLLSNAAKFSPSGSPVTLRSCGKDTAIRFEVIDSGPGIPDEAKAALFKKYSQLEHTNDLHTTGTGLGLFISKLLIEMHGGNIGVDATPEGGSCFWFTIPQPSTPQDSYSEVSGV